MIEQTIWVRISDDRANHLGLATTRLPSNIDPASVQMRSCKKRREESLRETGAPMTQQTDKPAIQDPEMIQSVPIYCLGAERSIHQWLAFHGLFEQVVIRDLWMDRVAESV